MHDGRQPGRCSTTRRPRGRHAASRPHLGEGRLRSLAAGRRRTSTTRCADADRDRDPDDPTSRAFVEPVLGPTSGWQAWYAQRAAGALGPPTSATRRAERSGRARRHPVDVHLDALGPAVHDGRATTASTVRATAPSDDEDARLRSDSTSRAYELVRAATRADGCRPARARSRRYATTWSARPHPPGAHGRRASAIAARRRRATRSARWDARGHASHHLRRAAPPADRAGVHAHAGGPLGAPARAHGLRRGPGADGEPPRARLPRSRRSGGPSRTSRTTSRATSLRSTRGSCRCRATAPTGGARLDASTPRVSRRSATTLRRARAARVQLVTTPDGGRPDVVRPLTTQRSLLSGVDVCGCGGPRLDRLRRRSID